MKILICDNEPKAADKFKRDLKKLYPDITVFISTDWTLINEKIRTEKPDIVIVDLFWQSLDISKEAIKDINNRIDSVRNGMRQLKKIHVPNNIDSNGICALNLIRQEYKKTELPVLIITRFGNFMLDPNLKKKVYSESNGFLYKWDDIRIQMAKINSALRKPSLEGKSVFIGHSHSLQWVCLKDYLSNRLKLPCEDFNRESPAGVPTTKKLEQMLSQAAFAFLVMTAEDEKADHTFQSRPNVIHEAGLFQGRLGFERAVIMLEGGCSDFSNITGLGQIRFPPGKIDASFDEVRKVLEREGLIK